MQAHSLQQAPVLTGFKGAKKREAKNHLDKNPHGGLKYKFVNGSADEPIAVMLDARRQAHASRA